jgi:hypothetical protein
VLSPILAFNKITAIFVLLNLQKKKKFTVTFFSYCVNLNLLGGRGKRERKIVFTCCMFVMQEFGKLDFDYKFTTHQ